MGKFEVLCVTMWQNDFSKIKEMNIASNVIFANQCDKTAFEEYEFESFRAKMISTQTRGVGINRNLALIYASSEICLFADDDIKYVKGYQEIVCSEFDKHPSADIIIFNIESNDPKRKISQIKQSRWMSMFSKNPFGGPRIAIRLSSIRKKNLWFTTLFGGGAIFPSGEDTMFIREAIRKGCKVFCSSRKIGDVSFEQSTWFSGFDDRMFWGKGAYYASVYPLTQYLWRVYFALRTTKKSELSIFKKMHLMKRGAIDYYAAEKKENSDS